MGRECAPIKRQQAHPTGQNKVFFLADSNLLSLSDGTVWAEYGEDGLPKSQGEGASLSHTTDVHMLYAPTLRTTTVSFPSFLWQASLVSKCLRYALRW